LNSIDDEPVGRQALKLVLEPPLVSSQLVSQDFVMLV